MLGPMQLSWSTTTDDVTCEAVLHASRALVGIAARSIATVGDDVSLAQLRVLVLLHDERQSMGDLASRLAVNPSTVTRVCNVLVHKHLITRVQSPDNRRTVYAELSRSGRSLVDRVMNARRLLIEDALTKMPEASQRRLARSLAEFAVAAGEASQEAWLLGWGDNP
ncbi:MAG: ywhA-like uncharacterized HTH-type transcriptional regulator [Acidimicrobiia bacterium]|nr:ywhA-like uncharacterized HTH-type transcriptional regulator [Acidimicrobiia bacterium]